MNISQFSPPAKSARASAHPGKRDLTTRSSSGQLEPTSAVLTAAVSSATTKRLLRMWLAPPVAQFPDSLARRRADSLKRTDILLLVQGPENWPLGSASNPIV